MNISRERKVVEYCEKKKNSDTFVQIYTYGFLRDGIGYTSYLIYDKGNIKYKVFPISGGVIDKFDMTLYVLCYALKEIKHNRVVEINTRDLELSNLSKKRIYKNIQEKWENEHKEYKLAELLYLKELNKFYSENHVSYSFYDDKDPIVPEEFLFAEVVKLNEKYIEKRSEKYLEYI